MSLYEKIDEDNSSLEHDFWQLGSEGEEKHRLGIEVFIQLNFYFDV